MTLDDLLDTCKAYRDMGDAVTDQLDSIRDGEDVKEQNPNALRLLEFWLKDVYQVGKANNDEDLMEDAEGELQTIKAGLLAALGVL